MRLSRAVKPISYIKAHAAEIIRNFSKGGDDAIVITQNGEAKAVLQDIHAYEKMQETLAMMKIIALSQQAVSEGKIEPAEQVAKRIRQSVKRKLKNEKI